MNKLILYPEGKINWIDEAGISQPLLIKRKTKGKNMFKT